MIKYFYRRKFIYIYIYNKQNNLFIELIIKMCKSQD